MQTVAKESAIGLQMAAIRSSLLAKSVAVQSAQTAKTVAKNSAQRMSKGVQNMWGMFKERTKGPISSDITVTDDDREAYINELERDIIGESPESAESEERDPMLQSLANDNYSIHPTPEHEPMLTSES